MFTWAQRVHLTCGSTFTRSQNGRAGCELASQRTCASMHSPSVLPSVSNSSARLYKDLYDGRCSGLRVARLLTFLPVFFVDSGCSSVPSVSTPNQAKTVHLCEDFHYQVLENNLPSLSAALVAEAMWAARHIVTDPATTRGGPWSSPKPLTESQLELVREVSKVRSCKSLVEISERDRRSALYRHLCSLTFASEPSARSHPYRGMFVRTSSRSGTPGNLCRSRKIFEGRLVKGSRRHKRSHRGVDVKARRAQETASRKPR